MSNIIIIGAGVVGLAIGYGLVSRGESVTILDEGAEGFKASRGNFGLVWCQGKGFEKQDYARITFQSCQQWDAFRQDLETETDLSVDYDNRGGLYFLFDQDAHKNRIERLESIYSDSQQQIDFEMLSGEKLKTLMPELGDEVYSASFCRHDATCDPLKLVYALKHALIKKGGQIKYGHKVHDIQSLDHGVQVVSDKERFSADKVIISAGLSNTELSQCVDIETPLKAIKGQILVSQRLPKVLDFPSLQVRQTEEGTIICGDSHEDVGLKTETTMEHLQKISTRSMKIFPMLSQQSVNRAWGALRVMTPDTIPIYEQSKQVKGVFNVSCHSGITLAAFHANELAEHIIAGELPESFYAFRGDRF
ncbi:FAD-binding oxidoreductase [Vibrio sp. SS-MA-C1-2]|uniref:NAD(P)/FAD-dependent oxidoreductase n=1 Tax=Vibrio sp. SS-MA-C1-2 TaxID=2908646 RepID=UPI001F15D397|nr:FAD-dependent oxidoreductase [Vibrio sp. SS-MA-C1-2]UJF18465.1 FAD-binding oxidoreductase [Vibrio sp. SS-MA-C1-2]